MIKRYTTTIRMTDEVDHLSLPIEERLQHKTWKVRLEAYDEISRQFQNSRNVHDEAFRRFNLQPELVATILRDSNVVAQESAVQALAHYVEYGGTPSNLAKMKTAGVISVLCEKGLSSSRAGTKAKTVQCLLLIMEISNEVGGIVEEIVSYTTHRLPKLVSGCVFALTELIANFGCQVVSPHSIIQSLGKLFGHADRTVRLETTKLTVELYKWMGDSLTTVLFPDLKPIQQKDLTKEFESVKGVKPEQKRLTRTQQQEVTRRKEQEEAEAAKGSIDEDGDTEMKDADEYKGNEVSFDPYDMIEPLEILTKLPSDLGSRVLSTKWKDRKEVLEEAFGVLEKAVKITQSDDYLDFVRILGKCMKDANLQVVQLAAGCVEKLAKGLKHGFLKYQSLVLGPIIERTKEKKGSVSEALANALDAIFLSSSLSEILDETLIGMKHKTPQVKISSTNYLQRCLTQTKTPPSQAEIELIMEVGVKLLSDSQEPVRQTSTEMIGSLMKITGERELASFLEKIDDNRKAKVFQFYEKVQVNAKLTSGAVTSTTERPGHLTISESGIKKPLKQSIQSPSLSSTKRPNLSSVNGASSSSRLSLAPSSNSTIPTKRGASSPAKRADESSKATTFGRGLTGRSLVSNTTLKLLGSATKIDTSLSLKEREELHALRKEKTLWLTQKQNLATITQDLESQKLEHARIVSQLNEKIDKLTKENSNTLLMLKQKESQIARSSSDLDNAKLKIRDLEQTIEMMKLQQNKYTSQLLSQQLKNTYGSIYSLGSASTSPNKPAAAAAAATAPSLDLDQTLPTKPGVSSGELSSRVNRLSIEGGTQKENSDPSFKSSSLSRFSSPQRITDNTNTYTSHTPKFSSDLISDDDSWKRAAEVTSQLKARIEKMKARSRSGMSNFS